LSVRAACLGIELKGKSGKITDHEIKNLVDKFILNLVDFCILNDQLAVRHQGEQFPQNQ
jgi:hypothetical protein